MGNRRFGSRPSFDGRLVVLDDDSWLTGYQHTAADPGTVWTITHQLGYDPAGIVVIDTDGYQRDGFAVQYLAPQQSLRLSFDIPIAGTAYLS